MSHTAAPGRSTASSLHEVAPMLWPAPCLAISARESRSTKASRHRYLVLPNAEAPRRLVPLGSRRAAAAAVWHGGGDTSLRTRTTTVLLSGALATGLAQRGLRDRWVVDGAAAGVSAAGSIEDYLAQVLSRPVLLSLRLGPPRANLKPVIEVLDRSGASLAYAKVGINPLTNELVTGEHEVLQLLARHPMRHVVSPAARHLGHWGGCAVLVLSSLPLRTARRTPAPALVTQAMVEVAGVGGTRELAVADAPFAARLQGRLDGRATTWDSDAQRVLHDLVGAASAQTCTLGRWHGDWHPGNMSSAGDGRLLLWDWERSCDGVPVGWDALHLQLQGTLQRHTPFPQAVSALRTAAPTLLAPFGVSAGAADGVVRLYLAELLSRYTADEQWAVPAVRPVVEGLLATLTAWTPR